MECHQWFFFWHGLIAIPVLTHWGRVTHMCVSKLTIIGSDNGLSPDRRQAIIWINAGILLIGPLGTNFSEIVIEIQTFSSKRIRLKMSSATCCSFRLGLNVLISNYILCIMWDEWSIHSQFSTVQPLNFGIGNRFIPHINGKVIPYPCWN